MLEENESQWKHVIIGNYWEEEGEWCPRTLRKGYGAGLWKGIRSEWEEFRNNTRFKVGDSEILEGYLVW